MEGASETMSPQILPSFLYNPTFGAKTSSHKLLPSPPSPTSHSFPSQLLQRLYHRPNANNIANPKNNFMAPAPAEPRIQMYSTDYFMACAVGGMLCCGVTHTGITPVDVVKCNMQIAPTKYTSIGSGFTLAIKEEGFRGLYRGWAPTLIGYSIQGAGKYGFYEFFKYKYSELAGMKSS